MGGKSSKLKKLEKDQRTNSNILITERRQPLSVQKRMIGEQSPPKNQKQLGKLDSPSQFSRIDSFRRTSSKRASNALSKFSHSIRYYFDYSFLSL
jgi:hypothetical protein